MEDRAQAGLGEYLRIERERRHITIEQVASATKINIKLLHALENDNFDVLPAKPFVRGFVTSYSRYIGLDHRDVLARFDGYLAEKSGRKFRRPEDAPHIFVEREGQTENNKTALTVVMVICVVVAAALFAILKPSLKHRKSRKDRAVVTNEQIITVVPPLPVYSEEPAVKHEQPSAGATSPTPPPQPAPAAKTAVASPGQKISPLAPHEVKYRLIVRAIEDAWVKYQVDDRPLQQYTLRKDKVIYVRARSSIRFTTGRPSGIEFSFDNNEFKPFGGATKLLVHPKEAEAQYRDQPFVTPNPIYLSTPNQ